MRPIGLTGQTFNLYEDSCCSTSNSESGGAHVSGIRSKWKLAHELGHLVSFFVDSGGLGANGGSELTSAQVENCDAGVERFVKRRHARAATQAVADFYAVISFNDSSASADCEQYQQGEIDLDLDESPDHEDSDVVWPCFGDPCDDAGSNCNANAGASDGRNWLGDMVAFDDDPGANECDDTEDGSLDNRTTTYDWTRYLWDMVTVQGVAIDDLYGIWDAADPHDWDPADGATTDRPDNRWATAAATSYSTAHGNAADHIGLE